jgi:hypothetical protein
MCPHTTTYVYLILLYIFCFRTGRTLANSSFETFPCSLSNPHTAIYESSYYICVSAYYYMCPHTTKYLRSLAPRPHQSPLANSSFFARCVLILTYVFSYYNVCVLILRYTCPRMTEVVSRELVVRACVSRDCCSASSIWKVPHEELRQLQLQLHM